MYESLTDTQKKAFASCYKDIRENRVIVELYSKDISELPESSGCVVYRFVDTMLKMG